MRLIILLLAVVALASCAKIQKQFGAFTPDRKTAYLAHEVEAPMQIPANLSVDRNNMQDYYPIPAGTLPPEGAEPIDIVPPPVVVYEQTTQKAIHEEQEVSNG